MFAAALRLNLQTTPDHSWYCFGVSLLISAAQSQTFLRFNNVEDMKTSNLYLGLSLYHHMYVSDKEPSRKEIYWARYHARFSSQFANTQERKGKGDFVLNGYIFFSVPDIMDSNELLEDVGKADVFLYLSWSKHTAAVRTAV